MYLGLGCAPLPPEVPQAREPQLPFPEEKPVTAEVRRIGLASLYPTVFAVGNCPNLTFDDVRFGRAERSFHLTPEDLTPTGRFPNSIAALSSFYTARFLQDKQAFCSASDLSFAIVKGMLRRQ